MKQNLIALGLGLLFALLVLEVVFRLSPHTLERIQPGFFRAENWFSFDPDLYYVLRRNQTIEHAYEWFPGRQRTIEIRTNSAGYRDQAFTRDRLGPGAPILAIGDSFTEGYHVPQSETWPRRLQARLAPGPAVLNLGVHNYSAKEYMLTLKYRGAQFDPTAAVIAVYLLNDVQKYGAAQRYEWHHDIARRLRLAYLPTLLKPFFQRSAAGPASEAMATHTDCPLPGHITPEMSYLSEYLQFHENYQWLYQPRSAAFQSAVAKTAALFHHMRELADFPVLMVLIPTRDQMAPAWWKLLSCHFGLEEGNRFAMQHALIDALPEWEILDLAADREAVADPTALYLPLDAHWSGAGHDWAAGHIAPRLREMIGAFASG